MILDFVDLSSDDDDDDDEAVASVHGKGHSVHVKAELIDLTSDEDIFEGKHLAYGQGNAAQGTTVLKKEFFADDGQVTAAQMEELRADEQQGDVARCTTMSQRQECTAEVGQGDAAQCIATLQMQALTADVGLGDAAQCTSTPLMQELGADDGQGDAAQCTMTLQREELTADDEQHAAAQCAPTLELTQDDEQGDVVPCTTTLQRQQLNPDDGQDAAALCTTTLLRQKSISDGPQGDVPRITAALQRQESDTAHGKVNAALCTTLHRQEFLAADDSMQENVHFRNSAESTTSLSRKQEESHSVTGFLNTSHALAAEPFSRQFWKAGEYRLATQAATNNCQNPLRIHPKFLHSNATSHKWAFGAIAELLDNAIDEVNNGATFVKIDKMKHSPDGDYALVIEDNGGGMSPESLRRCMSFGFSQKCTDTSIGQYGNGFKTSTMRLGADAIVFTCTKDNRRLTRSVGLLSYTFLMRTKCNDILVPAVDYEFDASSSTFKKIMNCGEKYFSSNMSTLLRWSPFSTEDELLNQFSDMECHGTKIIVFNLWFNDALEMELDFETDEQDIMISGAPEIRAGRNTVEWLTQMHVANRFRYSLRDYASILYLHVPERFQIILCGRAVEPHFVVNDLMYPECIKYRPQVEVTTEVDVITTIGYLRGAPRLDIYGFNVYHKNRLILPYWCAGSCNKQRRGIAGVLEANFMRPTHDKQDFERTGLFQRLETRLKDMATEYWTYHCHLVGYAQIAKRPPPAHYVSTTATHDDHNLVAQVTKNTRVYNSRARASLAFHPCSNGYPLHVDLDSLPDQVDCDACPSASINAGTTSYIPRNAPQQSQTELRRRKPCSEIFWRAQKRRNTNVYSDQPGSHSGTEEAEEGFRVVLDQNTMLKDECSGLEAAGKLLTSKADELRKELDVWRRVYKSLTDELQFYDGLEGLRRGGHHSNPGIGFI
ncbi:unnamed protein product [Urochloa decumbens]|uniref:Morc S5 domain-containing protein n=1 Tax=Urochloa decumbens TaxID=240449 RepID=A0ABC9DPR8_9POAL